MSEGFRTFDHTGDLGLEVWAERPARLYALAAEALLAQVAEPGVRRADARVAVDLTGDDAADLLVHWLNTALLHAETERAIWTRAVVTSWSETRMAATLEGPRLDPSRDVLLREIKAVSHHGMELDLVPPRCRCSLILDL